MMDMFDPNLEVLKLIDLKHSSLFAELMTEVFGERMLLDLIFVCSGKIKLATHKLVFASVSKYLCRLIRESNDNIVYISLPDVEAEDLRNLIYFLYEGEINVSSEEFNNLKKVTNLLGIELYNTEVGLSCENYNDTSSIKRKKSDTQLSVLNEAESNDSRMKLADGPYIEHTNFQSEGMKNIHYFPIEKHAFELNQPISNWVFLTVDAINEESPNKDICGIEAKTVDYECNSIIKQERIDPDIQEGDVNYVEGDENYSEVREGFSLVGNVVNSECTELSLADDLTSFEDEHNQTLVENNNNQHLVANRDNAASLQKQDNDVLLKDKDNESLIEDKDNFFLNATNTSAFHTAAKDNNFNGVTTECINEEGKINERNNFGNGEAKGKDCAETDIIADSTTCQSCETEVEYTPLKNVANNEIINTGSVSESPVYTELHEPLDTQVAVINSSTSTEVEDEAIEDLAPHVKADVPEKNSNTESNNVLGISKETVETLENCCDLPTVGKELTNNNYVPDTENVLEMKNELGNTCNIPELKKKLKTNCDIPVVGNNFSHKNNVYGNSIILQKSVQVGCSTVAMDSTSNHVANGLLKNNTTVVKDYKKYLNRISIEKRFALEVAYKESANPTLCTLKILAEKLDLKLKTIKLWFLQRKRTNNSEFRISDEVDTTSTKSASIKEKATKHKRKLTYSTKVSRSSKHNHKKKKSISGSTKFYKQKTTSTESSSDKPNLSDKQEKLANNNVKVSSSAENNKLTRENKIKKSVKYTTQQKQMDKKQTSKKKKVIFLRTKNVSGDKCKNRRMQDNEKSNKNCTSRGSKNILEKKLKEHDKELSVSAEDNMAKTTSTESSSDKPDLSDKEKELPSNIKFSSSAEDNKLTQENKIKKLESLISHENMKMKTTSTESISNKRNLLNKQEKLADNLKVQSTAKDKLTQENAIKKSESLTSHEDMKEKTTSTESISSKRNLSNKQEKSADNLKVQSSAKDKLTQENAIKKSDIRDNYTWFSENEKLVLLAAYKINKHPDIKTQKQLSRQLRTSRAKVYNWFCRRRQQDKTIGIRRHSTFTEKQKHILLAAYKKSKYPDIITQKKLAQVLHTTHATVYIWFANARKRDKNLVKSAAQQKQINRRQTSKKKKVTLQKTKNVDKCERQNVQDNGKNNKNCINPESKNTSEKRDKDLSSCSLVSNNMALCVDGPIRVSDDEDDGPVVLSVDTIFTPVSVLKDSMDISEIRPLDKVHKPKEVFDSISSVSLRGLDKTPNRVKNSIFKDKNSGITLEPSVNLSGSDTCKSECYGEKEEKVLFEFEKTNYPDIDTQTKLAEELCSTYDEVYSWFCERRYKENEVQEMTVMEVDKSPKHISKKTKVTDEETKSMSSDSRTKLKSQQGENSKKIYNNDKIKNSQEENSNKEMSVTDVKRSPKHISKKSATEETKNISSKSCKVVNSQAEHNSMKNSKISNTHGITNILEKKSRQLNRDVKFPNRLSDHKRAKLESIYQRSKYPDRETRETLADQLEIPLRRVNIWFSNKRLKGKSSVEMEKNRHKGHKAAAERTENMRSDGFKVKGNQGEENTVKNKDNKIFNNHGIKHNMHEKHRQCDKDIKSPNRLSEEKRSKLEKTYRGNKYPDRKTREKLAQELEIPLKRVNIWFSNKRLKRKSTTEIERKLRHVSNRQKAAIEKIENISSSGRKITNSQEKQNIEKKNDSNKSYNNHGINNSQQELHNQCDKETVPDISKHLNRLPENSRAILEKAYKENQYPDLKTREEFAQMLEIPLKRVNVWYNNKRSKDTSDLKSPNRLSDYKRAKLLSSYEGNKYPDRETRETLAQELEIPLKRVNAWFSYERTKENAVNSSQLSIKGKSILEISNSSKEETTDSQEKNKSDVKVPGIGTFANRLTDQQRSILEEAYEKDKYPCWSERENLAKKLGIPPKKVKIWFSNKRQKSLSDRSSQVFPSSVEQQKCTFLINETETKLQGFVDTNVNGIFTVWET